MSASHAPISSADVRVSVSLGDRSYEIHIGPSLLGQAGGLVRPFLKRPRTAIVTDENVARHHLRTLEVALTASGIASTSIVLPAGERTKSFTALARLCDGLLAAGIERNDCILAFGGGVIGDLAGFAAAILRRGIGFIQIPTSLLAQVDSSVGGKTGINSPLGKNLIGAFHQPAFVLADTSLLRTLPAREFAAGYAEVVKYGALGDAAFFDWLESNREKLFAGDQSALTCAIAASCRAKAAIVAADETETGVRALLNLGHTFGHALEAVTGFGERLLHGEGVAVGMSMAFRFSERLGHCLPGTSERIVRHLSAAGLPTRLDDIPGELPGAADLLAVMRQDKKSVSGKLTFILVRRIGEAFIAHDVREAALMAFLEDELARG